MGDDDMNPRVKDVKPLDNYMLLLTFTNEEKALFDVSKYLDYKYWSELKNTAIFNTVKVSGGSIEWIHGQDFCPDELYKNRLPVN
jgi:hypothetical protein